jgi:hypothetical protein
MPRLDSAPHTKARRAKKPRGRYRRLITQPTLMQCGNNISSVFFWTWVRAVYKKILRRKPARIFHIISATSSYSSRSISVPSPRVMVSSPERRPRWRFFLGFCAFVIAEHCVHSALLTSWAETAHLAGTSAIGDRAHYMCWRAQYRQYRIELPVGRRAKNKSGALRTRAQVYSCCQRQKL